MRFLGVSLNLTAKSAGSAGVVHALPYYFLIALVALTGWYQVRQTQARQLQSGNAPANAQMQAMTKIFPVFFAFICFGLNAGAILYFVVSNIWRIGQQQLVLGKLYDQGIAAGQIKPKEEPDPKDSDGDGSKGNGKGKPAGGSSSPRSAGPKQPNPKPSNGKAQNGDGKGQGMSSGARRKKRKR